MYILIAILLAICFLFFTINFFRRKRIIRKIRCMNLYDKLNLLNDLAEPFGFSYISCEDIMTSTLDAWQKNFGYQFLYDKSAFRFNMVFDCEPVYFDYNDHTWMIEFWKGQYGINIGGEIGIYKADKILSPKQYDNTLFHGVSDDELLQISMILNYKGTQLFSVCENHWWLTGFRMGSYCQPEDLVMDISITFPNLNMLQCFVGSLICLGYNECELSICQLTVSFTFSNPHTYQPRLAHRLPVRFSSWQNKIFCKLYNSISKPFTYTVDKILYLYFFLPIAFRRLLIFKRNRRQKPNKKHCKKICKKCRKIYFKNCKQ